MSEATDLQRRMFELIRNHDLEGLRALCHSDYTYVGPDGEQKSGADEGVRVAETYVTAFPDLDFEIVASHDCGAATAVMEMTVSGTHQQELEGVPATGKRIREPYCNVIEVRDGKVYRERDYFDNLHLMHQLGVTRMPESTGA
ncbi:ester cyclase [Saccharomonospora halophila]|uniref:ester cyclase n=1 Tax=Saccharomonospora halophila TaxID=129922 RepID=UPI00037C236A|nr:ester cyclase [Saccharomonospora halophila]